MTTATPARILLATTLCVLATACEHGESPLEPPADPAPADLVDARWADGYTVAGNASAASYAPDPNFSYNRGGGRITIRRPEGTTGRYIVTFTGLSAVLGTKSTVHVSSFGDDESYCKPMTAALVSDKVEVRCFLIRTGTPLNSKFTVVVLRRAAGRAFAFAHQPTSTGYAPAGSGSYNPAGTTRVVRVSTGNYQVVFNNLGAQLGNRGGHVQVNAVASGKAYCKTAEEWGGAPHLSVSVQCYTAAGAPVDAKFTVLFQLPSGHLAYAYANLPNVGAYNADPFWSSNPAGSYVAVRRFNLGEFIVSWPGADARIIDYGNLQVTALGMYDNAHCKLTGIFAEAALVRCFAANGTPVDVPFTILLGS
jgi:hypothetical protein